MRETRELREARRAREVGRGRSAADAAGLRAAPAPGRRRDALERIASDGAGKLPVFHRATAEGLLAQGRDPRRLALLVATFRAYVAGRDDAAYVALTLIEGSRAMVVGFRGGEDEPYVGAADLARVRRAVEDAEALRLPVVSVVDLVGGELSEEAEEAGVAREIARCLAAVVDARVPAVSVLLGKGSGGVALAIAAADAVVALEGSWLAPLPPEGAGAIVYRDTAHAAELARGQGITARDLAAAGGVDEVVGSLAQLGPAIARALGAVGGRGADERHAARVARYARLRAE